MNKSEQIPSQTAAVRRTDVTLRAEYPYLATRIFELAANTYQIVFDREQLDAEKVADYFHENIRQITLRVTLSNKAPDKFLREIEPITDHDIARGHEGLPFTRDDFRTVIDGKFPHLPHFIGIGETKLPTLTLYFERSLTSEETARIDAFMNAQKPGWPFEIEVRPPATEAQIAARTAQRAKLKIPGDPLRIQSARSRPKAPRFVVEDEAFWFDNIEQILGGEVEATSIVPTDEGETTCYIDATVFPQIDFRQALLCFDKIYLSPPLKEQGESKGWQGQKVTSNDFLDMVSAQRLCLVLSQPEERTDPKFLEAVYEANPQSIIGRRRASAVMAADIARTADAYRLNQPIVQRHLLQLASAIATDLKIPEAEIVNMLDWPFAARRMCLMPLMTQGLMSIGAFGLGKQLGQELQRVTNKDLQLEALMAVHGVHIAHCLKSTFIPPLQEMAGWIAPRQIIGNRLNFYRGFNTKIVAKWAANERRREEERRILPPVPLFTFEKYSEVRDLIAATAINSTRRKGRALLTRLSEIAEGEREAEIEKLARKFYSARKPSLSRIDLDIAGDVLEVAAAIAGSVAIPPLLPAWHLFKKILEVGRRFRQLDNFIDDLRSDLNPVIPQNTDLDFLSKIERVARLRTD